MDNRINEIRRKISALRLEMVEVEATVRDLVNRDLDCATSALHQLGLRRDMDRLIGEWRAAGGHDLVIQIRERVGLRAVKKDSKAARR